MSKISKKPSNKGVSNNIVNSIQPSIKQSADEYDVFAEPLIKKKTKPKQSGDSLDILQNQRNDQLNQIRVPLMKINVQQTFHELLYDATKQPILLRTLRQVLSQGNRELQEKKKYYHFKWNQLQNLNCSRNDYVRQEGELKALQTRDISEIQQILMQTLAEKGVQGFKSKDEILNEFRQNYMENRMRESNGPIVEEFQFYVDLQEATQLKKDQIALLERLMDEQQLIEPIDDNQHIKQQQQQTRLNRIFSEGNSNYQTQKQQEEQRQEFEKQQQQTYTLCDKINIQKLINDKLRNLNSQKIEEILKLDKDEFIIIQKNIRVMLLDSKSDEVYTDKDFQRIQNERYQTIYQQLKNDCPNDYKKMTEQQLDFLLEITTYLVNNAHYQQKYKQPSSHLQPKDIIALLDKIYK